MRLVLVHARASTLELLRFPAFSVPTLAFPALFFLLFVAPRKDADANLLLASFAGFAVLAVAFFQFGVGIAAERETPWERFLRTLPLGAGIRLSARCLSAALFGLSSSFLVALAAVASTDAHLSAARWFAVAAALAAGSVPFVLLGVALGYWVSPRGAVPVANALYLVLSFVGGLWTTVEHLPPAIASLSPFVPTRPFGDVLWGAARGHLWLPRDWLLLLGWSAVFLALARRGYRRDEGRRYG